MGTTSQAVSYPMCLLPCDVESDACSVAASMALSAIYGQHLVSKSSHAIVTHTNTFVDTVTRAASLGTAQVVEMFPVLNSLPEAFSPWKRTARLQQEEFSALNEKFLDETKIKMVCGISCRCIFHLTRIFKQEGSDRKSVV